MLPPPQRCMSSNRRGYDQLPHFPGDAARHASAHGKGGPGLLPNDDDVLEPVFPRCRQGMCARLRRNDSVPRCASHTHRAGNCEDQPSCWRAQHSISTSIFRVNKDVRAQTSNEAGPCVHARGPGYTPVATSQFPFQRQKLVSLIVSANEGQGRPFLIEPFCVNPSTRANLADRLERHQEHDAGVRASHSKQRPLDRRQWCQLADVNRNNDDPD